MGVELRVLRQDPRGKPVYPDSPPVRVVRRRRFGGVVDQRLRKIIRRTERPLVWYCSEPQEELLLTAYEDHPNPEKLFVLGGMGAGKTTLLAQWAVLHAIWLCARGYTHRRPRAIGATGATQQRIGIITAALAEVCRPEWFAHVKQRDGVPANDWILACGVTIDLRATKQQSSASGTPVQGQNWSAHVGDEFQDQTYAFPHILSRGRAAPNGCYRQLLTNTAKDSVAFREFRDSLSKAHWRVAPLPAQSNVFVWPSFWEAQKSQLSAREYRMLVLAEDVGPERAVYPSWSRHGSNEEDTGNLRPIPAVGARDVTAEVLSREHPNVGMLIGHDPGVLRNVSVLFRAFKLPGDRQHRWWIVDDFATDQTTTQEHADRLMAYLRDTHNVGWLEDDEPRVLVRTDPWTTRERGTHRSVYAQLREAGFLVKAANYSSKDGKPRQLPLQASIEAINRLFCSASGERRLFVHQNEDGEVPARTTMQSIELSEWDTYGQREQARKDDKRKDPTDYTSAVRYALWAYEKFRPAPQLRGVAL